MSLSLSNSALTVYVSWPALKVLADRKSLSLQYVQDLGNYNQYQIFGLDGRVLYRSNIYSASFPNFIDPDSGDPETRELNDAYLYDFESNYMASMNLAINLYQDGDPRWVFRLGNMTTTGSTELLVSNNGYFEQSSQGQRGVKSTSANDTNPAGSGAKVVRLTFLNSNYQRKVEDIALNGTNTVATVATDIRFVEKFEVIRGTAAAGKITLCTGSNGLGEICSIGVSTTDAFLCHHYVPSGSKAEVIEWDVTSSDDALMRLKGQQWVNGNQVDPVIFDLENLVGIASGSLLNFTRRFRSMPLQEKTYVRITAQSQQGTQTTIRARLNVWEDVLYVTGSS
jgi:hypothetical protein